MPSSFLRFVVVLAALLTTVAQAGAAPTITLASPNPILLGGPAFVLTITGTGFLAGATATWGTTPLLTTFVSSSQLHAQVSADLIAQPGNYALTVANPGEPASPAYQILVIPVIQSISPSTAPAGTGPITFSIIGAGFDPDPQIHFLFPGQPTPFFPTYVSSTQLSAVIPSTRPGSYPMNFYWRELPIGSVTFTFTVPETTPYLSSIQSSPIGAGLPLTLTITGYNFGPGSIVRWDDNLLNTTYQSPTSLTAAVPAQLTALSGYFYITVLNPDGASSNPHSIKINPRITGYSPTMIAAGATSIDLRIFGAGFMPGAELEAKLMGAGNFTVKPTYISSTELALSPLPISGVVSGTIRVSVPPYSIHISPYFNISPEVKPPEIAALSPASASPGSESLSVAVTGAWFVPTSVVNWNGSALSTTFITDNELRATVPKALLASAGTATITVSSAVPGGTTRQSAPTQFTIQGGPAAITQMTPQAIDAGGPSFTLTVAGTGFTQGSTVHWNDTPLTTTFTSATQLTAAVPANLIAIAHKPEISILIPGNPIPLVYSGLQVNPVLTSISPAPVAAGGSVLFTLTGAGFPVSSEVQFSMPGVEPFLTLPATYISSTKLTVNMPPDQLTIPGSPTNRDNRGATYLAVVLGGEGRSAIIGFGVFRPEISSISPSGAAPGAPAFQLTVVGKWFISSSVISWSGTPLQTTYVSDTQLRATVPANLLNQPGTAEIIVSNRTVPSFAAAFPIEAYPVITSVQPDPLRLNSSAIEFTINGTGFTSDKLVRLSGVVPPLSSTYHSATRLTATLTTYGRISGVYNLTVEDRGGNLSEPFPIRIHPLLTNITPATQTVGGALSISAVGIGFAPGSAIRFSRGGEQWIISGNVTATTITATLPPAALAAAGEADVAVIHQQDGTESNVLAFAIKPPNVTTLTPESIPAGTQNLLLTITGAGFLPDAAVRWNQQPLATTYVSPNQLTAQVPATLIAEPGTASITVATSAGTSAALTFHIVANGPIVPANGVVSVFSPTPKFAPGSLISIYGQNLAAEQTATAAVPAREAVEQTSATLNGTPIPLLFVSPSQINAQIPAELPPGKAALTVKVAGAESSPVEIEIAATAPTILTNWPANHAIALNIPEGTINSPEAPAAPGQYITLFLTGQGAVNPTVPTGANAPATPLSWTLAPTTATLGGKPVEITFSGLAPGFMGLAQINLIVPALPAGDHTLNLSIGQTEANTVTLSVRATQ